MSRLFGLCCVYRSCTSVESWEFADRPVCDFRVKREKIPRCFMRDTITSFIKTPCRRAAPRRFQQVYMYVFPMHCVMSSCFATFLPGVGINISHPGLPEPYTGWPRKNATLTIDDFKKTRHRINKLCPLLRIKFFFQQDDTKIINFNEGVWILWPFFWGNVIFKICHFCIKSHNWRTENFHCLAPPGKVFALAL